MNGQQYLKGRGGIRHFAPLMEKQTDLVPIIAAFVGLGPCSTRKAHGVANALGQLPVGIRTAPFRGPRKHPVLRTWPDFHSEAVECIFSASRKIEREIQV